MSEHQYRLIDEAGDDLGLFETARDQWETGDRLPRSIGSDLEVIRVVEAEPHEPIAGFLVVKDIAG